MKSFILKINRALAAEKKIYLLCLLLGSMTYAFANDTIRLADSSFGIDDIEAFYYTSGGNNYYTFAISNYDTDVPTLHVEIPATDKTHIQGSHEVILTDFTWIVMTDDLSNKIFFSRALFWLKFTGKNIDGDSEYDILFAGNASDGKVYLYRANMPVYAYDRNNGDAIIVLQDALDDSVVEPELPHDDGPATDIENVSSSFQGGDRGRLILRDGQIFILRGDKTYTLTGQEVK